ncbi:hypothetical protein F4818DRAFT_430381 [Hypoxylon cercidicola]|nr:hypothetical protein F4818DRAFT_430381 [Hypoxylon cercidicola]
MVFLPPYSFIIVIEHLVVTIGIYKAIELRSVSRYFNAAILYAICVSQVVDIYDEQTPYMGEDMPSSFKGEILLAKPRSPEGTKDEHLKVPANVNEALDRIT